MTTPRTWASAGIPWMTRTTEAELDSEVVVIPRAALKRRTLAKMSPTQKRRPTKTPPKETKTMKLSPTKPADAKTPPLEIGVSKFELEMWSKAKSMWIENGAAPTVKALAEAMGRHPNAVRNAASRSRVVDYGAGARVCPVLDVIPFAITPEAKRTRPTRKALERRIAEIEEQLEIVRRAVDDV